MIPIPLTVVTFQFQFRLLIQFWFRFHQAWEGVDSDSNSDCGIGIVPSLVRMCNWREMLMQVGLQNKCLHCKRWLHDFLFRTHVCYTLRSNRLTGITKKVEFTESRYLQNISLSHRTWFWTSHSSLNLIRPLNWISTQSWLRRWYTVEWATCISSESVTVQQKKTSDIPHQYGVIISH